MPKQDDGRRAALQSRKDVLQKRGTGGVMKRVYCLYRVSTKKQIDRDAIQELKEAAQKKEFDILLVFMFDRIGRNDDEMPFVVEWFAKHGIEVWSTQEGQSGSAIILRTAVL